MPKRRGFLRRWLGGGDEEAAQYLREGGGAPARGRPIRRESVRLQPLPPRASAYPEYEPPTPNYPPIGGPMGYIEPRPEPVLRVRPLPPEHPGNYSNFADYVNTLESRAPPPLSSYQPPVEPLGPRRGLEPPSAPVGRSEYEMENEAWREAQARARLQTEEERRQQGRRIPRPGRPLISQAWSSDDR